MFPLLLALVKADNAVLPEDLMTVWNGLMVNASKIADQGCSQEISQSFNDAVNVYKQYGFSSQYFASVQTIKVVAGDIPEAGAFRAGFTQFVVNLQQRLAQMTSSTSKPTSTAVASTSSSSAPKPTADKGGYDYGIGQYGTVSGAEQSSLAAALLLGAVILL